MYRGQLERTSSKTDTSVMHYALFVGRFYKALLCCCSRNRKCNHHPRSFLWYTSIRKSGTHGTPSDTTAHHTPKAAISRHLTTASNVVHHSLDEEMRVSVALQVIGGPRNECGRSSPAHLVARTSTATMTSLRTTHPWPHLQTVFGIGSARWSDGPLQSGVAQGFNLIPVSGVSEAEGEEKKRGNGVEGTFNKSMTNAEMTFEAHKQIVKPLSQTCTHIWRAQACAARKSARLCVR